MQTITFDAKGVPRILSWAFFGENVNTFSYNLKKMLTKNDNFW